MSKFTGAATARLKGRVYLVGGFALLGFSICGADDGSLQPSLTQQTVSKDEVSLLERWGFLVARDQDLIGVELNDAELTQFLAGARANLQGKPAPSGLYSISHDIERLALERRQKLIRAREQENEAAASRYFSGLKTRPSVTSLSDGTVIDLIHPGSGRRLTAGETVRLNYRGQLLDGTEFTQMSGYDLILVKNRICAGLFEALQTLAVGSEARIYLPPAVAREDRWAVNLPPGAATMYDVSLLAAKETAPDDLANALLPAAPEPPEPPPSGKSVADIIEAWGWTVGHKTGAEAFHLSAEGVSVFANGLKSAIRGQKPPASPGVDEGVVTAYVAAKKAEAKAAQKAQRMEAMNRYLDGLRQNPNVVALSDGLRYEIVQTGTGPYPSAGDTVIVSYTARLIDGTVFDRTDNEPLHIEVGSVIAGWNEGIQHVNRGGRIRLYIPPALGYGESNTSGVLSAIPGSSLLIYDIELLDTVPANKTIDQPRTPSS